MCLSRAGSAKDVVKRGQEVWVKVITLTGQRMGLSMRDVDQATGQDLLPGARVGADGINPTGPTGSAAPNQGLRGLSGIKVGPESRAAASCLSVHACKVHGVDPPFWRFLLYRVLVFQCVLESCGVEQALFCGCWC